MILAWVAVACGMASALMMLACVATGAVLRLSHQIVICEPAFNRVRDQGLWATIRPALSAAARGGARWPWKWTLPRKSRFLVLAVIFVPTLGYIASAGPPTVIMAMSTSPGQQPGRLADLITHGAILAGAAGAVTGTYLWVNGLAFIARPELTRRLGISPLVFPDGLSQQVRDHLAINVYWRSRLSAGFVFSAIYPWWFLATITSSSPSSTPGQDQGYSVGLELILLLIMMAPMAIPAHLASCPIHRRLLPAKICEELCTILKRCPTASDASDTPRPSKATPAGPDFVGFAVDPSSNLRRPLARLAANLDDTAALTDRRQQAGLPPHPAATLMRAVANALRQYLGSRRSLQDTLPGDMEDLLTTTLVLFAAHHDQDVYQRLADKTSAFRTDGSPAVETTRRPPGRLVRLGRQAIGGVPKMSLTVTSIATLAAIIIALILALSHAITYMQFAQLVK